MWTSDKAVPFSEHLDLNEVNIICENLSKNETGITCILNKIQKLFENAANSVLGHEREYKVDANAKQKPIKFNRETLNIRNNYYKAKKLNDGSDEKKKELNIKSKAYKKAVSKAQAFHRKNNIKKIRIAKTKCPKYFWSLLNRQSNSTRRNGNIPISPNDFFNGFKALSGTNIHGQFVNSADESVDNACEADVHGELANQILNSEITVDEIHLRVKDLKNGKACGTDKILNDFSLVGPV